MKRTSFFLSLLILLFAAGCSPPPAQQIPRTGAQERMIQLCKTDYNLDIVTYAFDNTLWIYLTLDNPYLSIVTSKKGPAKSTDAKDKPTIKFLDGEFKDYSFQLRYHIALDKFYPGSNGIETKYSDEFLTTQRNLLQAIARTYAEVEKEPGSNRYVEKVAGDIDFMGKKKNATHKELVHSYVKTEAVPDFFVIVIADITKGIESKTYLYLQDLRRAMREQGFGEEYRKRVISDQPIGHTVIIEDKKGTHLDTHDLTWGEFLAKQIVYRTNFKYTQSSFPPSENTRNELLTTVAETVQAYDFKDFTSVILKDINKNTVETANRSEVENIHLTPPPSSKNLHYLNFTIGAPEEDTPGGV